MDQGAHTVNPLIPQSPELSPLEQEVLEEYERLAENMKQVNIENAQTGPRACA